MCAPDSLYFETEPLISVDRVRGEEKKKKGR